MSYVPNTNNDRGRMLQRIGVRRFEDLLDAIPEHLRLDRPLDIPALSELELLEEIKQMSRRSREGMVCFAGGGVYDHFIPSAVGSIINRPEFMTAYTPYQAEVSQGTLQVMYEFQSHICRLTGLDVANSSMYDGASAAAEAVIMAMRVTRRDKIVVSETVNPLYREVIATYLSGRDVDIVTIPHHNGHTDFSRLADTVDEKTAGVLVGQPNFFGLLEDVSQAAEIAHKVGAKLIMAVDPIAQAITKTAADYGADIAVGEGQPLGVPVSFGGPLLGFFAATKDLIRQMPGRIAARTTDVDGKIGYVLFMQTREQHIRREKATSNICTNQMLCATAASVHMTLLGKEGLKEVALLSAERAQSAAKKIFDLDGFEPYFDGPFVREFAVKTPVPAREVILALLDRQVLPGIDAGRWYSDLDDCLIVAATEKRSEQQVEQLVGSLKELATGGVLSRM